MNTSREYLLTTTRQILKNESPVYLDGALTAIKVGHGCSITALNDFIRREEAQYAKAAARPERAERADYSAGRLAGFRTLLRYATN